MKETTLRTAPYAQLNKAVIWVLREYEACTTTRISEITGWSRRSVYDELRRLIKYSLLGNYISKEKDDQGRDIYKLSEIAKTASIDFLIDIGRKSFDRSVYKIKTGV